LPTHALRAGDVKARSREPKHARAARSAAALYVAEHSAMLWHVMAGFRAADRTNRRPDECQAR